MEKTRDNIDNAGRSSAEITIVHEPVSSDWGFDVDALDEIDIEDLNPAPEQRRGSAETSYKWVLARGRFHASDRSDVIHLELLDELSNEIGDKSEAWLGGVVRISRDQATYSVYYGADQRTPEVERAIRDWLNATSEDSSR